MILAALSSKNLAVKSRNTKSKYDNEFYLILLYVIEIIQRTLL